MNFNKLQKNNRGMTLLETLLYAGIVVIVAGLAVGTLLTTIKVQDESTSAREVSEQSRFILEQMTREVRDSSIIDISTSTPSSKLVLRFGSTSRDYVAFYASSTALLMDEGTTTPAQALATTTIKLTSDKVYLLPGSLSFIRIFNPPSKDAVQVSFTLYYNSPNNRISSSTKPFVTTLYRISSSIFDNNLVPSINDALDVGSTAPSLRWKNARFSDKLLIGLDYDREVVSGDINSSDRLVLGGMNSGLKLLGATIGEFIKFTNYNNDFVLNYKSVLGGASEFEALRIASSTGNVLLGGDGIQSYVGEKLEVSGDIISKGTEWTTHINLPSLDLSWSSVAYGNGLFVAVATSCSGNCIMTSLDGINWTTSVVPVNNDWTSVVYGNGLFVAVSNGPGFGNRVMTSSDGVSWTIRSSAADVRWNSITYGNGLFVAVANSGTFNRVMTSPDGVNWTIRNSASTNSWRSVTYGNGLYVAVANTSLANDVMTSRDGVNWISGSVPTIGTWSSVTYGNGLFVAVANDKVITSPDGIVWTSSLSAVGQWSSVTYGNGLFVAVAGSGSSERVMTSQDGISWTIRSSINNNWQSVAHGNGIFVVVANAGTGNRIMTSGKSDILITPHNNIYQGGMTIMGPATGTLSVGVINPQSYFTVGSTTGSTSISILNITQDGLVGIGTSSLPTTGLSLVGNLRVRDKNNNRYFVDYYSNNSSSTFATFNEIGNRLTPLSFKASSINFKNYKTNQNFGFIDSSNNWYLAGSSSTGIRFSSDPATSTILKAQGNLLLADGGGNGYVYLQAGRVGIGTNTPNSKLQVYGNVRIGTPSDSGSVYGFDHSTNPGLGCLAGLCMSDVRLKKNLEPLVGSLDKIIQLNPVSYNWKADEFPELKLDASKTNIGLIAQEVEKIFPEIVEIDEKGFKALNYGIDLRLHILEAIKELKFKNDALRERAKILESR